MSCCEVTGVKTCRTSQATRVFLEAVLVIINMHAFTWAHEQYAPCQGSWGCLLNWHERWTHNAHTWKCKTFKLCTSTSKQEGEEKLLTMVYSREEKRTVRYSGKLSRELATQRCVLRHMWTEGHSQIHVFILCALINRNSSRKIN